MIKSIVNEKKKCVALLSGRCNIICDKVDEDAKQMLKRLTMYDTVEIIMQKTMRKGDLPHTQEE